MWSHWYSSKSQKKQCLYWSGRLLMGNFAEKPTFFSTPPGIIATSYKQGHRGSSCKVLLFISSVPPLWFYDANSSAVMTQGAVSFLSLHHHWVPNIGGPCHIWAEGMWCLPPEVRMAECQVDTGACSLCTGGGITFSLKKHLLSYYVSACCLLCECLLLPR